MSTLAVNAVEFGAFWFTAWPGPERIAFAADSDQALRFLTPRIGPSSVVVLHRVSRGMRDERLIWWDLGELGRAADWVGPTRSAAPNCSYGRLAACSSSAICASRSAIRRCARSARRSRR
jgi:hypothetical protein